jgi:hypothetical protein
MPQNIYRSLIVCAIWTVAFLLMFNLLNPVLIFLLAIVATVCVMQK